MSSLVFENHNMPEFLPFKIMFQTKYSETDCKNWHRNPEFLYCFSGDGYVAYGQEKIDFKPGTIVSVNPNILHAVFTKSTVSFWYIIIDVRFFEENGLRIEDYTFKKSIYDMNTAVLFAKLIKLYFSKRTPLNIAETRAAVINFITDMCRRHTVSESAGNQKPLSKTNETVKEVIEYINTHFAEKISLDSIAKQIHLSKYHFARIFRDCTGSTVTDQINIRRCAEAKNLITTSDTSISEIATICGFENASYFSKVFKKHFGIKPSDITRR